MKILKRLAVVVVIVVVTAGAFVVPAACIADAQVQERTDELRARLKSDVDKARSQVLDDQRALAGHWLLARREGGRDASAILSKVSGWKGRDADIPSANGVPSALEENIKLWQKDWANHVDDVDLTGVDLAWMKELAAYDHWDVEADGSPMNTKPWRWYDQPIPNFIPLQTAAKVRLLQGLRDGKPIEAVHEVRELARLATSTDLLIGEMIGVALMKIELKAKKAAEERKLDVSAWPPITEDEADRLRRTLWSANAFFQLLPVDEAMEKDIVVGRCGALLEGGSSALFLRGLLGDRYAERYASLEKAINASPCRLKNLRRAWNDKEGEGELPATTELFCTASSISGGEEPTGCHAVGAVLWVPYVKEAIGEILLSMASLNWFQQYLEPPTPAN